MYTRRIDDDLGFGAPGLLRSSGDKRRIESKLVTNEIRKGSKFLQC